MKPSLFLCLALTLVAVGGGALAQPTRPAFPEIPATDGGLPGAGPVRRAEWYRNLWKERRAAFAERAARDHGALVFVGDSITQGLGDDFGGRLPGVKAANRGIGGDTTRTILLRVDEDVVALDPAAVILLMGTNDIEDNGDPEAAAGNLKLIIGRIKAHNARTPIVLCQAFPSSASKNRPAARLRRLNDLFAAAVKGDPQVILVETWPLFANGDGEAKPEEFPDLLHPNEAGYAKWIAGLRPILATLGFVDNEPDPFVVEPGFTSLFNGRDLTGWGFRPTSADDIKSARNWARSDPKAPPWPIVTRAMAFDGAVSSPDGRYLARNGRLVVTTPAEGRRIQQLSTTREFPKDFILKLEFRASPNADSGIFIREPQLQCRDYLLAGPYKQLKNYKAQDWNEIVVEVHGRKALCTCNGEVLEGAFDLPATGPIGLEGDRGQMEYRRLRFKELE